MSDLETADPRNMIREAYRIDGITLPDCRTIFLDWALGVPGDSSAHVKVLLAHYGPQHPAHPMTEVLRDAQDKAPTPQRRGGRGARHQTRS